MVESEIPGKQEDHQGELAAEERHYQRVGHRADGVSADVHPGPQQIALTK